MGWELVHAVWQWNVGLNTLISKCDSNTKDHVVVNGDNPYNGQSLKSYLVDQKYLSALRWAEWLPKNHCMYCPDLCWLWWGSRHQHLDVQSGAEFHQWWNTKQSWFALCLYFVKVTLVFLNISARKVFYDNICQLQNNRKLLFW